MNSTGREFGFRSFIFLLLYVFLRFKVVFRMVMIDFSVHFGLYSGDYFDRVEVLFKY